MMECRNLDVQLLSQCSSSWQLHGTTLKLNLSETLKKVPHCGAERNNLRNFYQNNFSGRSELLFFKFFHVLCKKNLALHWRKIPYFDTKSRFNQYMYFDFDQYLVWVRISERVVSYKQWGWGCCIDLNWNVAFSVIFSWSGAHIWYGMILKKIWYSMHTRI